MRGLLYILTAVMLMAGCGQSYEEKRQQQHKRRKQLLREDSLALKIAVMPTLDCLPLFLAKDHHFFDSLGVDVRLKMFTAQMDCDTALQRGRVEGAVTDLVRAERMIKQGTPLAYLTATNAYWQLYSNRMARIKKLEQLDDKMVGMTRYSATALLADAIVDSAKLQQERVFKIQVNDVNIRLKMLIGGEIDAVLLTEPQATLAREAHHQLLLDSRRLDIQFGAIALREVLPGDTLRQRQVEVLKKGYNQACDSLSAYGLRHYADILSKHYKLREDQLDSLILSMKFAKIAEPREADIERARKWLNQ